MTTAAPVEPTLNLEAVAIAVGADALPEVVRSRLGPEAALTCADFRALSPSERAALRSTVEQALAFYRTRAGKSRAGTTRDSDTADAIARFLDEPIE